MSPFPLRRLLALLLIVLLAQVHLPHLSLAGGDDSQLALRTAAALYEGIRTETLENGLRIFLKPVPGAAEVTTMVAYKVGSADEDLDSTGLSHYLEHLMFKGTDELLPGAIDRLTFRNGGANNAYTSEDCTIYHFDFPPDRWEVALQIEADRMRNLRIDARHEFEEEKGAVLNELTRDEDQPWDLENKAILPLLFGKKTPYGHPIIGETEHVRAATAKVIKSHYDKWYHPNNAALVVCGNFDPDQALALIKKRFGSIPRAELPPRKTVVRGKLQRPARLEFESKFSVPRLLLGFNTIAGSHPDYAPLAVLERILGTGKTSRLYKGMVEGAEIASDVSASNSAGRYPGWFSIQVELLPGKDRTQAEKLVLEELAKLRDQPVGEAELKRAQRGILAGNLFNRESVHDLADSIARGVTVHDLDWLKRYLPSVLAVTAADVQRVARKYFDPEQRVAVWSIPPKVDDGKPGARLPGAPAPGTARARARKVARVRPFSLKDTRRVELPNGLVLLLFEDHRLPIFVAASAVHDTRVLQPAGQVGVDQLVGALLDEGTPQLSGEQIAEQIEGVGGTLAFNSSGGVVRVLAPDRSLGLNLLLRCLMNPRFPKEAFRREKTRLLAEIEDVDTQPEERARQAFRAAVYGAHPYGRPPLGTKKTVTALTEADCVAFHRRAFVPNNVTLALAGDFDSDQVVAEVTRLTADWRRADLPALELLRIEPPKEPRQVIVTMADAAQLHVYMGEVGIRRDNPDYYKLLVMDYIFGTGPGFTDRLSSRLRDREGLAYTVTANITSSADREPGTFTFYIGTDTKNFARVKKEFLEELGRLRDEKPAEQEVADVKAYLLGNLLLQFTTNAGIAAQLLTIERHQLGFQFLEDYRQAVAAVTPEDVQAVARKYLDPQRLVIVAAGAIDPTGEPVQKIGQPKK
jgi:zinc protease